MSDEIITGELSKLLDRTGKTIAQLGRKGILFAAKSRARAFGLAKRQLDQELLFGLPSQPRLGFRLAHDTGSA